MGNCLKISSTSDDISLLRGNNETQQPVIHQVLPYREFQPSTSSTPSIIERQQHLTEDEDHVKLAKRIGLMQHLPIGKYEGSSKKARECAICMAEFCVDETFRYLPCMHIYHVNCIDDWLMRSLTCPSCVEPVDSALLTSYETT